MSDTTGRRTVLSSCLAASLVFALASAMVSTAKAQGVEEDELVPWKARVFGRLGPPAVGGKVFRRSGNLWWRSDNGTEHEHDGVVEHLGDVVVVGDTDLLLVGLDDSQKGVFEHVQLDGRTGFKSVQSATVAPVKPLVAAYVVKDSELFVLDQSRKALLSSIWTPGSAFPTQWETARTSSQLQALTMPGVALRPAAEGGIKVSFHGAGGQTWVRKQGLSWASTGLLPRELVPTASVSTPVRVEGPVEVHSGVVGMAMLESRQDKERVVLGKARAGSTMIPLASGVNLDARSEYRVVVESDSKTLRGEWFRPRRVIGRKVQAGSVDIHSFDLSSETCYVGSPHFAANASVSCRDDVETVQLLNWFWIQKAGDVPDITMANGFAFLRSDVVLVQDLELRSEKNRYLVAAFYPIPTDPSLVGGMVYGQFAVLGRGPEDVAISDVCGVMIEQDTGKFPRNEELGEALVEQWVRQGSMASEYQEGLLKRVLHLVDQK